MVTLAEARTLDYSDIARLLSYSAGIVESYLQLGGYRTPAPAGPDMLRLRHEARIWTREVARRLSTLALGDNGVAESFGNTTLSDLSRLVDSYDIMHRIGFRKPDDEFLREMRQHIAKLSFLNKQKNNWLKRKKQLSLQHDAKSRYITKILRTAAR